MLDAGALLPGPKTVCMLASEARALMELMRADGKTEEASAHYETYKQHMNTLKQLEERALPGLGAFLAEPETVLGKRGRGETDDDDASKGGEQEEEEEE